MPETKHMTEKPCAGWVRWRWREIGEHRRDVITQLSFHHLALGKPFSLTGGILNLQLKVMDLIEAELLSFNITGGAARYHSLALSFSRGFK